MDARTARPGWGLFAACIGLIVAGGTVAPVRAESLAVHLTGEKSSAPPRLPAGSATTEFAPGGDAPERQIDAPAPPSVANLVAVLAAGTVLFGDSPSDFTPPTPTPVDNPLPPLTNIPIVPTNPNTPLTPTSVTPPDGGIIQGNPNPEPASLLIGVIGSVCGGAAVWCRRRKRGK